MDTIDASTEPNAIEKTDASGDLPQNKAILIDIENEGMILVLEIRSKSFKQIWWCSEMKMIFRRERVTSEFKYPVVD